MEPCSRPNLVPIIAIAVMAFLFGTLADADIIRVTGNTGDPGISVVSETPLGVEIHYEMDSYSVDPLVIDGETYQKISLPAVFLPNDAGAPDLPGMGRFIAMPQGSIANLRILASRTQTVQGVEVSPAPVIPREDDDSPQIFEKDPAIYGLNALYPTAPVLLSAPFKIRGVDAVTLGITPFQYNPVTKELIIFTELDVRIDFTGGNGQFGDNRLRSRYWEPILANQLLNYGSLPSIDFESQGQGLVPGYEYVIITPDDPVFIAWGDTLKAWRKLQGISTEVFTTTDIGGTSTIAIESWLNNAYNTWNPAPAAFLILGDYPSTGILDSGITSPIWNSYCVSDNIYADVDGDDLPEMVHARITARDGADLETMIGKMLDYERNPYVDPGFYDHPIISGGWQTERWFILCTEIVLGHQVNVLGKHPVREYAIYSGTPGSVWSSNQNTNMLVDYFGPNGLGYIPQTPSHLTDWGANATRVNNDINAGAFMLLHRDHGGESGWGEPNYGTSSLSGLHNDMLPFVFSINCLTGKYNWGSECFTERFHRMGQGALGLTAASEVSYSFVNDTFIFGLFDGMWPDFMPDYGPHEPYNRFPTNLRPAFGMANGKYFLQASSWPYNPQHKVYTHHLFHHHGDAFLGMYSEVPQHLTVDHDPICLVGTSTFGIRAEAGAMIGLTVDGEIVGAGEATGGMQNLPIIPQTEPGTLRVTVTKANYYRYDVSVPVTPPDGPYLTFDQVVVFDASGDGDGIIDAGETVELEITLENVGTAGTNNVSAILSTEDVYANITTSTSPYPDIPMGGTGINVQRFVVEVAGNMPDAYTIDFALDTQATQGQWDCDFNLPGQAPVLTAGAVEVDDSTPPGNGDGGADPGEPITLALWVTNIGHSAAAELTGMLSTTSPHVAIIDAEGECPTAPIGVAGLMGTYQVDILPTCPDASWVSFQIDVTSPDGFQATLDFDVQIGPWFDNAEAGRGWTLGAPGDNATSGIWIREDPIGTIYNTIQVQPEDDHTTDPGTICFVTGNGSIGGAAGENDVDGGKTTLLSPFFDVSDAVSASVSYWRWYTNNAGNGPDEDWWDVDVTTDGLTWVSLEHTTDSANSWSMHSFELRDYVALTDQVQMRFVAADEINGSLVEAAVDDFSFDVVRMSSSSVHPLDVAEVRASNGIVSCSPNPFNPHTSIVYRVGSKAEVTLSIYDVNGRMIRSLVSGIVEPGEHAVAFDGRTDQGSILSSGVYFLRLDTPEFYEVNQITLIK